VKIERIKTKTRLIVDERLPPQFGAFLTKNWTTVTPPFPRPTEEKLLDFMTYGSGGNDNLF
jgi:hypothetical protein